MDFHYYNSVRKEYYHPNIRRYFDDMFHILRDLQYYEVLQHEI